MKKHWIFFSLVLSLHVQGISQLNESIRAGRNIPIRHINPFLPIVEPHLTVNPLNSNHYIIAAMVFDSAAPTVSADHIVVFSTMDNGETWKQVDLEMIHGGDPWVALKDSKQAMLVALVRYDSTQGTSLVSYSSSDGGTSWTLRPVKLGGGHDHPTMIMDPKTKRLYLLSSLIKRNESKERIGYAYLNYSDDWKKFKDSALLFSIGKNNSNTLTAAVLPNGSVIAPYIEHPSEIHSETNLNSPSSALIKYIYAAEGAKFSSPRVITDNIGTAKGFAVMAVDNSKKHNGRIYFVKNTGNNPARSNGLFLKYADSADGPWSEDIRIDHNYATEKFIRTSAIAINNDGIVGIAWVDRRNDPKLKENDVYFTASFDGGKTFKEEIRVTDISSDPNTPGNGKTGERFMSGGDYMGLAAKPDGSFQVVWADSRTGVFQLYTSTITLNK